MQHILLGRTLRPFFYTLILISLITLGYSPLIFSQTTNNNYNKKTEITIKNTLLSIELVDTPTRRALGLMHRKHLAENHGMLFIFQQDTQSCFWMKNTYIPLSIAFIDDTGSILNIEDMTPLDERPVCPHAAYRYALEVNQGWFATHTIQPGDRIAGSFLEP